MISKDTNNLASPRLLETLNNLCYSVARLKQKEIIDEDDVKEVTAFYGVQLVQHLSQVVAIPSDPRDLAVMEILKILRDSKFKHGFTELLKTAYKNNQVVSQYVGWNSEGKRDWSVATNRRVRAIRDRLTNGENNKEILIHSNSPLVISWRPTYTGGDRDDASSFSDNDNGSANEVRQLQTDESVIDMIDMIDTDKEVSEDNNNNIQDTTERNNDSDFGDGTTSIMSIMSIMSISSGTSEPDEDLHIDDKDKQLPPYVSRLYPGSDLFKCHYCNVRQDRWGMAKHFHPTDQGDNYK